MREPNDRQRSAPADDASALSQQQRWRNELHRGNGRAARFPGPGAADAADAGSPPGLTGRAGAQIRAQALKAEKGAANVGLTPEQAKKINDEGFARLDAKNDAKKAALRAEGLDLDAVRKTDAGKGGIGGKAADAGMKAASVGGQAAGAATEIAGKGVQAIGKGGQAAGRGLMSGGAALSGTGIGAIAGVPMMVAGGALTGAGMGVQAGGKAAETVGKGTRAAAKGVGKFQQARERGSVARNVMKGGALPGGMPGLGLMKGGAGAPGGGDTGVGSMQAQALGGGGAGSAYAQARMALKAASPLGKLQMAKEGLDIAKQVLKNPKIRWKLISRGILASGGTVLVILVLLAPLITLAFIIASFAMDFKISGKEMVLMAAINAVFAFIAIYYFVLFSIMMCVYDPSCLGSAVLSSIL